MLPHPTPLWRHILCRILGAALGLLALACAIYMLAGCSAASFDVAEAKQGETAGEDAGVGADSGAPGEDTGAAEASADADAEGGNDGGCTLYAHHGPVAGTLQDWHSCTPQGVPGDPSTYSKALADEQIAHAKATGIFTWTWGDTSYIACNGDSSAPTADGDACATLTLHTGSGPETVTWCWGGSLAGAFVEANDGRTCPTLPTSPEWW